MSYFVCDNCEKKHYIYGESHIDEIAKEHGLKVLAKLPMDPSIAKAVDKGEADDLRLPYLDEALDEIEKML